MVTMILFALSTAFAQDATYIPHQGLGSRPGVYITCADGVEVQMVGRVKPKNAAEFAAVCEGHNEARAQIEVTQTDANSRLVVAVTEAHASDTDADTRQDAVSDAGALAKLQSFDLSSLTPEQLKALDPDTLALLLKANQHAVPSVLVDGDHHLVATGSAATVTAAMSGNGLGSVGGFSTAYGLQNQAGIRQALAGQVVGSLGGQTSTSSGDDSAELRADLAAALQRRDELKKKLEDCQTGGECPQQ